jgi:hypothetical protein
MNGSAWPAPLIIGQALIMPSRPPKPLNLCSMKPNQAENKNAKVYGSNHDSRPGGRLRTTIRLRRQWLRHRCFRVRLGKQLGKQQQWQLSEGRQ